VGANYDSKSGVLILKSQVKITTSSNGKSAVVEAAYARLLRASMQAFLTAPTLQYETEDGSADAATVYFRKDGTTEKIDAQGHVRMQTDTGATVASETAQIAMNAKSQPTQAELGGGVTFGSARGNDTMHGTAAEGTLHFATVTGKDGKTQTGLRHAQFRNDVNFTDEIAGLAKDPRGRAEKQVQGQTVDVDFAPQQPGGPIEARQAVGEGNPVVTMRQMPSKGPATVTRISGDRLVALLGTGNVLETLDGAGHTKVVEDSTDGAHDASQGDLLHATFTQEPAPAASGAAPRRNPVPATAAHETAAGKPGAPKPKTQTTLATAVQDGNVALAETPAKKAGATTQPATLLGWAQHAEYHAADQVLHLTGSPRVSDSTTMQLAADTIDYHRDSQDAAADGEVKATYTQPPKTQGQGAAPALGGNGPVHVIADRATLHHATNVSRFFGTVRNPARMWQDPDSLTAPVIQIDRNQNLLQAWGENTGTAPVVHANFTSAFGAQHEPGVARVTSATLNYSDKERQADFRGAVTLDQGDEVTHADDALVFLKPARASGTGTPAPGANAGKGSGSQIDHVVATGHVVITQPGRRGDGEKLVYTADDGNYVLTGTPAALPHLWDRVHGTTAGAALLFNSQNDSVEVSGGKSSAVTDTRAPK
jgi:lipopolysaccharide export system protein LptA